MTNAFIIIPFHFSWDWPADYLKQTAIELSKNNTVWCFLGVEQIRLKDIFHTPQQILFRKSPSLWLFRPIQIIPFERFETVRRLNMFLNMVFFQICILVYSRTEYVNYQKIVWICNYMYYFFVDYIMGNHTLLYDCVDVISDLRNQDNYQATKQEDRLIQKADVMTVISHSLYDLHNNKHKGIHVVPQGFRFDDFKKYKIIKKTIYKQSPIIGFVGTLDDRIDYTLLYQLVTNNPQWVFELWGKVCIEDINKKQKFTILSKCNNIKIGSAPHDKIPQIILYFDIAIIPYDTLFNYNKYCYPMKLFEYFYMGKPVVSTPIKELERFREFIKIGQTLKEWEKIISSSISNSWPKSLQHKQRKLAIANSWGEKIDSIMKVVSG
jgi:hypothetical protein